MKEYMFLKRGLHRYPKGRNRVPVQRRYQRGAVQARDFSDWRQRSIRHDDPDPIQTLSACP